MPQRTSGFTLVELLVVICVVAILAALLLVGINKFRASGNRVKCANNLRQIGTALMAYAADNDGRLVAGSNPEPNIFWYNALEPYMGSTEALVDSPDRPAWQECPSKVFKAEDKDRFSVGYGWNYTFFGQGWSDSEYWKWYYGYGTRLASVPQPAQTIIIGDSMDLDKVSPPSATYQNIYLYFAYGLFTRRHGGKGNYLFLDGHVEAMTPEQLRDNDNLMRREKM